MDLPIKFPSDTDVIRDEVSRFRALSPEQRKRFVMSVLRLGAKLISISPHRAFLKQSEQEQHIKSQEITREVLRRYAT